MMNKTVLMILAALTLSGCVRPYPDGPVDPHKPISNANPWDGTESWAQWNYDHPQYLHRGD